MEKEAEEAARSPFGGAEDGGLRETVPDKAVAVTSTNISGARKQRAADEAAHAKVPCMRVLALPLARATFPAPCPRAPAYASADPGRRAGCGKRG